MAGILPGITFKYYSGSEQKTRRSSDPPVSSEDPWVRKSELHQSVSQNEVSSGHSLRKSQLQTPNYKNMSRESLDWLVYLNRNQLPTGKYINPLHSLAQNDSKDTRSVYENVPAYVTLPRGVMSPTEIPKHILHKSMTFCSKPTKPQFVRSYSTPASKRVTPDKDTHPASSIAAIKESERLVEEMENYMRMEQKVASLAKFPTELNEKLDEETDPMETQSLSRHASQTSLLSNSSQSSYESNLGSTESLVLQIQNFPSKVAGWKATAKKTPTPPVFTLPPPSAYKKKKELSASVPCSSSHKHQISPSFMAPYLCNSKTESSSTSVDHTLAKTSPPPSTLTASNRTNPVSISPPPPPTSSPPQPPPPLPTSSPPQPSRRQPPPPPPSQSSPPPSQSSPPPAPPQITPTSSPPLPPPSSDPLLTPKPNSPRKSVSMPSSPFHQSQTWNNIENYPQYHSPVKFRSVSSSPNSTPERSISTPMLLPTFSTPTKHANPSVSNPTLSNSCSRIPVKENVPFIKINNHVMPDEHDHFSISTDEHFNSSSEIKETKLAESSLDFSPNLIQYSSHSMPSLVHMTSTSRPSSPALSSKGFTNSTLTPPLMSRRANDRRNSAPQNCRKEIKSTIQTRHQSLKLDRNVSLASLLEGVPTTSLNESALKPIDIHSRSSALRNTNYHHSSSDDVFHKNLTGSPQNLENFPRLDKSLIPKISLHPSDSAFSIQSETAETLHEDEDEDTNSHLSTSDGSFFSVDSVCDQPLAEPELFRDSAIYCDMDIEPSPTLECPLPPKATIKEYVQYLEEKQKCSTQPKMSGAKKREPSQMIRQRLRSLQEHASYKNNRHSYEEEVSELSQISVREINKVLTKGPRSMDDSRCPYHSTASVPLPCNLSKCSHSLGSLDRLNCEPSNSKGWVKQVVTKFQTDY